MSVVARVVERIASFFKRLWGYFVEALAFPIQNLRPNYFEVDDDLFPGADRPQFKAPTPSYLDLELDWYSIRQIYTSTETDRAYQGIVRVLGTFRLFPEPEFHFDVRPTLDGTQTVVYVEGYTFEDVVESLAWVLDHLEPVTFSDVPS